MKKKIIKAPDFLADKSGVLEFRLWRFVERHPKMKTAIENVLFQNGVRNVEVDYEAHQTLHHIPCLSSAKYCLDNRNLQMPEALSEAL